MTSISGAVLGENYWDCCINGRVSEGTFMFVWAATMFSVVFQAEYYWEILIYEFDFELNKKG